VPQFTVVKKLVISLCQEGIALGTGKTARAFKGIAFGVSVLAVAGCAASGDPGSTPTTLSGGETCPSIRSNLLQLDKEGVQALVERQNSGKKLSPAQKAKADLYNRLLDKYLGARCHV